MRWLCISEVNPTPVTQFRKLMISASVVLPRNSLMHSIPFVHLSVYVLTQQNQFSPEKRKWGMWHLLSEMKIHTIALLLVVHFYLCISTFSFGYYFEPTWTLQTGLITCMVYIAMNKTWIFAQRLLTNQEGRLLPPKCHCDLRFHIIKFSSA